MRDLDKIAIRKFGIPSIILMENAGRGVAEEAAAFGSKRLRRVLILCGKGNNGGDGFVAARHLHNWGFQVDVRYLAGPNKLTPDARLNFNILRKMKLPLKPFSKELSPKKYQLIVDALFGTGLSRAPEGRYAEAIRWINGSGLPVLSVDIPSGLDAKSGRPLGEVVRAGRTVALGVLKVRSGRTVVKDISIPRQLIRLTHPLDP